ncbi:ATP-binding protein [Elusimicrobiota bacterium]
MRIKLLYKFILVLVIIAVIPLTLVGIKMININKTALQETTRYNHITTARFLSSRIDDFVGALREKLLFLISSQVIGTLDFNGKQALIQSLLSSTDYFVTVSMVNSSGEEYVKTYHPDYAGDVKIKNIADTQLFKQAQGKPAISGVYRSEGDPRMDVIYPLSGEYVFITITLKKLWEDIRAVDIGKEAETFLVDGTGRVLAHKRADMEGKVYNIPPVEAVQTRASIGSMEYEVDGKRMMGAYAPVESMGWGIVTQQPYKYAYYSAIEMKKHAYRWIVIVAIAAVLIAYFLARGLYHPIQKLINGARAVSAGDFNRTVDVKTRDELYTLSDTFNKMVKSLKRYNDMQVDKIDAERAKTKAIVFSIEDGIVLFDHKGKIMLINDRALELLGIEDRPEEGEDILKFVSNKKLIKVIGGAKEAEIDLSAEGRKEIVKAFSEEVSITGGKDTVRMCILRDITLEKEVEKIRERFLQSITHDLKNPLAAIIGMSDLLKRERGEDIKEVETKYFHVLKDEAGRLMGMINDILNLAKLEAGKMKLNIKKFNLSAMVNEIEDTFFAEAEASGVKLKTDMPEKDVKIKGDSELIIRVLINLLGNAIKYTPKGGSITIAVKQEEAEVEVSVIDSGKGIPEDMREIIFDRFQQIKGRSRGGTGIGLNVSKEIIEAHEGKIWVESEAGKGSSFKFTVPDR